MCVDMCGDEDVGMSWLGVVGVVHRFSGVGMVIESGGVPRLAGVSALYPMRYNSGVVECMSEVHDGY